MVVHNMDLQRSFYGEFGRWTRPTGIDCSELVVSARVPSLPGRILIFRLAAATKFPAFESVKLRRLEVDGFFLAVNGQLLPTKIKGNIVLRRGGTME